MEPIYGSQGDLLAYYDPNTSLVYDQNYQTIYSNGSPVRYDVAGNEFIVDSAGTTTPAATVTVSTPPANVPPSDWVSLFTDAIPKVITGLQAWQLSQINVQRAQGGLPPLNAALYAPGQSGFMANMSSQSMMLIAGIGALFLLSRKK